MTLLTFDWKTPKRRFASNVIEKPKWPQQNFDPMLNGHEPHPSRKTGGHGKVTAPQLRPPKGKRAGRPLVG